VRKKTPRGVDVAKAKEFKEPRGGMTARHPEPGGKNGEPSEGHLLGTSFSSKMRGVLKGRDQTGDGHSYDAFQFHQGGPIGGPFIVVKTSHLDRKGGSKKRSAVSRRKRGFLPLI